MRSLLFGRSQRDTTQIGDYLPQRNPGRGTGGQRVTWDTSLSIPAVWACVRLRADLLSTLPIDVYARREGQQVDRPTPAVLINPAGDECDITEWLWAGQVSLDLRGNNYGRILDRDGHGLPTQIELVHPDLCSVRYDSAGLREYRFNGRKIPLDEVWHERAFAVAGSPEGLSIIRMAAAALGVDLAAESYGADWFASGSHPSAMISNDNEDMDEITQPVAAAIKDRFLASVRRGEPAVMSGGWRYQAVQVSPGEAQFLETQRWGVQQIARLFGLPPEMIGGESGASMTYANVEQRSIDFLTFGFGPTIVRRERALSRLVPQRQYVKLNVGALLRTDLLTRYRSYQLGIGASFLTPDEAREHEDMPPLTPEQIDTLAKIDVKMTPSTEQKAGTP